MRRLLSPGGLLVETHEVVPRGHDIGVIAPQQPLQGDQGSLEQRDRLGGPARLLVGDSEPPPGKQGGQLPARFRILAAERPGQSGSQLASSVVRRPDQAGHSVLARVASAARAERNTAVGRIEDLTVRFSV